MMFLKSTPTMMDKTGFAPLYLEGNGQFNRAAQTPQQRDSKHMLLPLTLATGVKLQRQFGESTSDTSP